jgi:hypothetical protein
LYVSCSSIALTSVFKLKLLGFSYNLWYKISDLIVGSYNGVFTWAPLFPSWKSCSLRDSGASVLQLKLILSSSFCGSQIGLWLVTLCFFVFSWFTISENVFTLNLSALYDSKVS